MWNREGVRIPEISPIHNHQTTWYQSYGGGDDDSWSWLAVNQSTVEELRASWGRQGQLAQAEVLLGVLAAARVEERSWSW